MSFNQAQEEEDQEENETEGEPLPQYDLQHYPQDNGSLSDEEEDEELHSHP